MQKPNITVAGFFNMLVRSTPAKVALSSMAILALLFVLLGGPPAGALAQDEPTATETLAAFDTETPTATETPIEPTATEEPTLAADTATEEPTATETLAESETPTVDLTLTVTPIISETPTEIATTVSCEGLGVDELCATAVDLGAVRVIVELDMNYVPPAQLSASAERAQENAIENNQEALADDLLTTEEINFELDLEIVREFESIPFVAYAVNEVALAELAASPLVENIYPDNLNAPILNVSIPLIGAPSVWWDYGFSGNEQTVAILDTGVMGSHEMFTNSKLVSQACYSHHEPDDFITSLCPGNATSSTAAGSGLNCSTTSGCDHGTHVAGIAAGNDPWYGYSGVARDAKVISIQVFTRFSHAFYCGGPTPCLLAYDSDIIAGLQRVLDLELANTFDIAAANLSLGSGLFSGACNNENPAMTTMIDALTDSGIAVVVSAGNDGKSSQISYPACISSAISVGATNDSDQVASFSNRSSQLDLYAPGVDIYSAWTGTSPVDGKPYINKSGTSMAAPHVTGAWALLKQAFPTASVSEILAALKSGGVTVAGKPRLNVLNALRAASTKPVAPQLNTPANNTYNTTGVPTLGWDGVVDAYDYEIQMDTTNTFAVPLSFSDIADFVGETTSVPLADGVYYWRVRGYNEYDAPGPWSTVFKFTVDTTAPVGVNLSAPADGATITTLIPKFTWAAVPTAVQYELQVGEDITFLAPYLDHTLGNVTSYQLLAGEALHPEVNYWRVRAIDIAGNPGPWTQRAFTPFLLQSPTNLAFITDQTPLLKWFAAAGTSQIEVQIDNNADFTSPEVLPLPLAGNQLQYQAPDLALGQQHWRIRVETVAGWSEWSPAWTFTVANPAPAIPVLVSPLANALTTDTTPDLGWNAVAGADHYQVQIDDTADFSSTVVEDPAVPANSFTSPTLGQGAHYWRVRAFDVHGQPGPWSAGRKFTVDSVAPAAPVLQMPTDGGSSAGNPNFTWTKAADVAQSQVQIDTSLPCDFVTIEFLPWVTTASFKPTSVQFSGTGDMCWRVLGKDAAGNATLSTTERTVTINQLVPLAPGPITPTNAFFATSQPTLQWGGAAYAANYEIQVSNTSNFAVIEATATDPAVSFTPGTPLNEGVHYWRVRGINSAGLPSGAGPFSAVRTFTVDTIAPADAPDLLMPLNGNNGIGIPTFTWSKPNDGTQTRILIDEIGGDFSSPLNTPAWGTATSFKPTPAQIGNYVGPIRWKVEGRDNALLEGPDSAEFTYTIHAATPAKPVLQLPANNSFTNDLTPALDWGNAANAVSYDIEIATNSTFTPVLNTYSSGTSDFTIPADLAANTAHYWRVRGENSTGAFGLYSSTFKFTTDTDAPVAPVVLKPDNLATSVGNPTFTWQPVTGATHYQLEIDFHGFGFASPDLYQSPWITATSFKPSAADFSLQGNNIQWHVFARDAAGNVGPASGARDLEITPPVPPIVPTLAFPANNSFTDDNTPNFVWSAVPYGDYYEIWVDNNSGWPSKEIDFTGAPGSMNLNFQVGVDNGGSPATLADGKYYWWVWGYNTADQHSVKWSSIFTFTIDTLDPAAPVLAATPLDGADFNATALPTFTWQAVAGATAYKFQYDEIGQDFTDPIYESDWLTVKTHKPTFDTLGDYSWRVIARDAALNLSSDSNPSVVRTLSIIHGIPVKPVQASPANNASTTDNTPTFVWGLVTPWAASYQVDVATNSSFTNIVYHDDGIVGTANTATLLPNGTYYWRVGAVNGLGQVGPFSTTRILKIVP